MIWLSISVHLLIQENKIKELQESDVVLSDLNVLGWVILKLDSKLNSVLNEPLTKLCAVDEVDY